MTLSACLYAGGSASVLANVAAAQPAVYPTASGTTAAAPASPPPGPAAQAADDSYDDQDPTALQDFRPTLDAHGTWVDDPTYGTVWVPNATEVGGDFTPYVSQGHWTYGDADDGYLWVSGYDWGWAPFHFGRWVKADPGGWAWVPGRQYAPAWVEWRTGDGYVGWAPTPPGYLWRGGVAVAVGFDPPEPYVFCADPNLFSPTPTTVIIVGSQAQGVEGRTRVYSADDGASASGDAEGSGGHGAARAGWHPGPPPVTLGFTASAITYTTGHDEGTARARAFARPSTAVRMGAHPPVRHFVGGGLSAGRLMPPAPAPVQVQYRAPIARPYRAPPEPQPRSRAMPAPERAMPAPERAMPRPGYAIPARAAPSPPVRSQPAPAPRAPARPPPKKK